MNRHDTDVVSLVFGIVFAAVVGWWLLLRWVSLAAPGGGWFIAAALIVFGVAGIVANIRRWRHREAEDRTSDPIDQS
jgi:hypothetical protein